MKAVRYYGPGDFRVEETGTPQPKQGQIQVKVICGTDLHAYLTELPMFPSAASPNAITGETLPVTLGHEFSGTVSAIGDGINPLVWPVGQKVVIEPIISCNMIDTCKACASGTKILCPLVSCIGIGGWGGGLGEYIAVNTENVYKLPDNIPLEVGACIEPLAVAWHAVKRSNFKKSHTALILGAGPIGIFIMKALRAVDNTSKIIISEPSQFRRQLVEKHGATLAIDPYTCDVSSIVKKEMGIGADFVFDAAGTQATMDCAIQSVCPRGMIVMVSSWEKKPQVDMNTVVTKEVQLIGTCCYDGVHSEVLEAVETGKITGIEEMITMKIGLEDIVKKGIKGLLEDKDKHVKILIHP
ncbi:alcohol dehydrogenase GroES domain protein [Cyathus striatus]|nr:alcohol dehydrogenase GroES domain protein [Cyathus striatus]